MRQSPVLLTLLLIIAIKFTEATIKVNFTYDEFNQYTANIAGQEFKVDERGTKVFGKHPPGKKSSDVKVIDCADKENNFEQFPSMLGSIFGEAEVLLLQNSGIKQLTYESFVHTKKVKIIMFGKDKFSVVEPAVFRDCHELEVLKFDDMDLTNLNDEVFEGIENLKILSMKNCEISRLNPELLEPLANLNELHITDNPMKVPPISAIQRMTHLRVLNLSGNKMTHLHDDLFKNKDFLEFVDVSKNVIHEVERDILLHWPAHATINMEGNTCIDRKFDHIGTDSLTISDVANALMPCFYSDEFIVDKSKEDSSASVEISFEKSKENTSSEFKKGDKKSSEAFSREVRQSKSKEISKESKIIEKLQKVSKSSEASQEHHKTELSSSSESKDSSEEKKSSKSVESTEKSVETDSKKSETSKPKSKSSKSKKKIVTSKKSKSVEKKSVESTEKSVKDSTSKETSKSAEKSKSNESKSSESTEAKSVTVKPSKESTEAKIKSEEKQSEKLSSGSTSLSKSREKSSKEVSEKEDKKESSVEKVLDDEVVARISPFEFIEQGETSTTESIKEIEMEEIEEEEKSSENKKPEGSTKKKKIKVKKVKKTTTEAPTTEAIKFVETPEPATNFLHSYEQAWCRFFIDADNKYNCVIENVSSEVKHINAEHLSGYDNSKVVGLYLRHSVLIKLPVIFFNTFENLEHLSVEKTNIKQLDEDTVKDGCGKLKSISLKDNKIRRLERHALVKCEHLEDVDLTGNPMEYIEGDIFNYNPKLSITMGSLKIVAPALTSF